MIDQIAKMVKERDEAFTDFVLTGNKTKVETYCRKYGVRIPKNEKVFAAGIYKAVQEIKGIPKDIKEMAADKCRQMGFKPEMG